MARSTCDQTLIRMHDIDDGSNPLQRDLRFIFIHSNMKVFSTFLASDSHTSALDPIVISDKGIAKQTLFTAWRVVMPVHGPAEKNAPQGGGTSFI